MERERKLNKWFKNLDTSELANIFSIEFEHTMMSADPEVNINTFIDECKKYWNGLSIEEKEHIYLKFFEEE